MGVEVGAAESAPGGKGTYPLAAAWADMGTGHGVRPLGQAMARREGQSHG